MVIGELRAFVASSSPNLGSRPVILMISTNVSSYKVLNKCSKCDIPKLERSLNDWTANPPLSSNDEIVLLAFCPLENC